MVFSFMEHFFGDTGFPDAERACGTVLRRLPWPVLRRLPWPVLRRAERNFFVRQHRLFDTPAPQPVAGRRRLPKRCFGSGCARPVATLRGADAWKWTVKIVSSNYYIYSEYQYIDYYMN